MANCQNNLKRNEEPIGTQRDHLFLYQFLDIFFPEAPLSVDISFYWQSEAWCLIRLTILSISFSGDLLPSLPLDISLSLDPFSIFLSQHIFLLTALNSMKKLFWQPSCQKIEDSEVARFICLVGLKDWTSPIPGEPSALQVEHFWAHLISFHSSHQEIYVLAVRGGRTASSPLLLKLDCLGKSRLAVVFIVNSQQILCSKKCQKISSCAGSTSWWS